MEGMDVLWVASTGAASLAKISANFSFCCPFPKLPVESPVVAVFCLPVETVKHKQTPTRDGLGGRLLDMSPLKRGRDPEATWPFPDSV